MINNKIKYITTISIFASIICIISPISINIGIIPLSFSLFSIYIIGALSKKWMSLIATMVYIFIGIIGLPVFSNFNGGIGIILGPTGGYIISYIPCVIIVSLITNINKNKIILYPIGMIIGTIIVYLFGSLWFMFQTDNNFYQSLIITVVPFIIFDLIKIILASICSYMINNKTPYQEMIKSI